MKSTTSIYYVEVKENVPKRVPHTKRQKYTEFLNRRTAVIFLDQLIDGNPGKQFRLCKATTTHIEEKWQTKK